MILRAERQDAFQLVDVLGMEHGLERWQRGKVSSVRTSEFESAYEVSLNLVDRVQMFGLVG